MHLFFLCCTLSDIKTARILVQQSRVIDLKHEDCPRFARARCFGFSICANRTPLPHHANECADGEFFCFPFFWQTTKERERASYGLLNHYASVPEKRQAFFSYKICWRFITSFCAGASLILPAYQ